MGGSFMREYLVMYKPDDSNDYQSSIHIWPEIKAMLKKMKGVVKVYDLITGIPQQIVIRNAKDEYWLETLYGTYIEG